MFKKCKKTLTVATLGMLAAGEFSPTASAHTLVIDFKGKVGGAAICEESLKVCISAFEQLVSMISVTDTGKDESKVWDTGKIDSNWSIDDFLSNLANWYNGTSIVFEANTNGKGCVVVLKNGTVNADASTRLFEDVNFPFEVIFENVGGTFGFPSDGFTRNVTSVGFVDCKDLELTEAFFNGMRKYDNKVGCLFYKGVAPKGYDRLNWKNPNEIIDYEPAPFSNVNPKSSEFKVIKNELKFQAIKAKEEPPKESSISDKIANWESRQGGMAESAKQLKQDFKDVKNLFSSGTKTREMFRGLGKIFKIKELGYKPGQGKK